jgi:mRNA-degrading endonuclease RelE of RelBE toxin-antitoxin system
MGGMMTVIETPAFLDDLKKHGLNEEERRELINYLAAYPKSGDIIQGTGGVRKVRFAGKGKGKSGGYRVVYYYHDE